MPRTKTKTRTGLTNYEKTSPTWKECGRRWDGIAHPYTVEKC
jgi:hypothetical protein